MYGGRRDRWCISISNRVTLSKNQVFYHKSGQLSEGIPTTNTAGLQRSIECLDVRNCTGFPEDDEEILKISSGIKNFQCGGSKAQIDFNEISFDDLILVSLIICSLKVISIYDIILGIDGDKYCVKLRTWKLERCSRNLRISCLPFLQLSHLYFSVSLLLTITILWFWGLRDCSISAIEDCTHINCGINVRSSFSEVCYLINYDSSIPLFK